MSKVVLRLEGLNCAGCAAKIEDRVNNLMEVQEASLNFTTKTLFISSKEGQDKEDIVLKAKEIVNTLEPDVIVSENKIKFGNRAIVKGNIKNKEIIDKEEYVDSINKKRIIKFGIGVSIYAIGIIFKFNIMTEFIIFLLAYILIGGEIVAKAFRNILKGEVFDENFLMTIATLGAFAIKEFPEAVAVMIFYEIGELFQDKAVNKSRKSIEKLMDIRADYANVKRGDKEVKLSPEQVKIGDEIIVKPGEKIPLDGVIIKGSACLDTSALTGESLLRDVKENDEVLSGCINKNGVINILVNKKYEESTVSKILDLVQNAGNKKAKTEKFITKFAKYYTPVVVMSALALAFVPPLIVTGEKFSDWIYRALVFLVVSCPCALVVSIPLGFFGGIGAASKNGILVKGGNYLEALKNLETVIFDKTGTLTKGVFKVYSIKRFGEFDDKQMIKYAAYAESYSNHPIAKSIVDNYGLEINKNLISDYEEISGYGIKAIIENKEILIGNDKLMREFNINYDKSDEIGTIIHLAINKCYTGYIVIGDEIKEDAINAIKHIKEIGINETIMLTGDNKKVADAVGQKLGITKVYSGLLPNQKVQELEKIFSNKSEKGKVAFVGDGINDAPVLARADVGIAMGGVGSDAAIEAADVVIMTDEISKIPLAIKIAKKTNTIVWQNIIFALSVKIVILIFGAMGLANMWEAVFGDVGVALIAIVNSMRAIKIK